MNKCICPRCVSEIAPRTIIDPRHPGRLVTSYSFAPEHSEYRNQIVCATCYIILERTPATPRGPSEVKVEVTEGTHHVT